MDVEIFQLKIFVDVFLFYVDCLDQLEGLLNKKDNLMRYYTPKDIISTTYPGSTYHQQSILGKY